MNKLSRQALHYCLRASTALGKAPVVSLASQTRLQEQVALMATNKRLFFGGNKNKDVKEDAKEEAASEDKEAKEQKEESTENTEQEPTSSGTSSDEEVELTPEDIKKIKALIKEQDETISDHQTKIEELEKQVKDFKTKLAYQLAENDNTVKRYRKQIEDGKQFAIQKFAKELLDVRDSLALAE